MRPTMRSSTSCSSALLPARLMSPGVPDPIAGPEKRHIRTDRADDPAASQPITPHFRPRVASDLAHFVIDRVHRYP